MLSYNRWSPKDDACLQSIESKQLCDCIVPLAVDATTEYLSDRSNAILEHLIGPAESDNFANCIQSYVLSKCLQLLVKQSAANRCVEFFHESKIYFCLNDLICCGDIYLRCLLFFPMY